MSSRVVCFFFFQAEDGIRDHCVTGVQTCSLPIYGPFHTSTAWNPPKTAYSQGGPNGLGWLMLTTAPLSAAARIVRSTALASGSRNSHQRLVPHAFQCPPYVVTSSPGRTIGRPSPPGP